MVTYLKYVVAGLMVIALAGLLGVADVQAQGYFKGVADIAGFRHGIAGQDQ